MTEKTTTPAPLVQPELADKRRTPPAGDRPTNFILMEAGFVPDFDKVTAVATVAFTPEGDVVAAEENRGPDLPGGHVREDEDSPEATARREAEEETGIILGVVYFLRAIQSDRYGSAPEDLTYMVIMAAIVVEQGAVPVGMTKHIMTPDEFYARHRGLRKEMVRTLVLEAQQLLFPKQ